MTLAGVFRHDEVEGASDCFLCRVAEHPLGAAVPESDQTAHVRVNNCVGSVMDKSPTEPVGVESEIVGSRHNATFLTMRCRRGGCPGQHLPKGNLIHVPR